MPDQDPADRSLPIELSSVVSTLETLTREMTKNLSARESEQVVATLCERLKRFPDDQRAPNRPFSGSR